MRLEECETNTIREFVLSELATLLNFDEGEVFAEPPKFFIIAAAVTIVDMLEFDPKEHDLLRVFRPSGPGFAANVLDAELEIDSTRPKPLIIADVKVVELAMEELMTVGLLANDVTWRPLLEAASLSSPSVNAEEIVVLLELSWWDISDVLCTMESA